LFGGVAQASQPAGLGGIRAARSFGAQGCAGTKALACKEPGEWKTVRRGWFLGGAELKEQLLEQMGRGVGEHHGGEEKRETDAQKAERIVGEELRKRRWSGTDLTRRRKTDRLKVQIAARLRRETVQTLDWIAQRLGMGCRHTLANCLKRASNYQ
jgi:hypothetical protein